MKGYISKYDRAKSIAKSYGYRENDFGFQNVVKQIFAKLIVGNKTISKINGKLKIS